MNLNIDSTIKLNNGIEMPRLGFGTWRLTPGDETFNGVGYAIKAGYRLIDTASQYGNEVSVGKAIQANDVSSAELFVTTKLWNDDHGYKNTLIAFEQSLHQLKLDTIDLYLIHFPKNPDLRRETWQAMEKIAVSGQCQAIGVSNFTVADLEEILSFCEVLPAVNQIELHPFMYQKQKTVIDFCNKNNIIIEAYRPLTKGKMLNDDKVVKIANKHKKTPAQVLIRWSLDHGWAVIPKSSHEERVIENQDIFDFELSEDEIKQLDDSEFISFM